jgi:hypothetical protein
MDNNDLLKCSIESKHLLETYASEERQLSINTLNRRLSAILGCDVSYECLWRSLAIVNRQSWKECNVLLTVIVRCNRGLPGLKFWLQAKNLGAIAALPTDYQEQKRQAQVLTRRLFDAYKKHDPITQINYAI